MDKQLLETGTIADIAREIFYNFEINQSATISGFVTNVDTMEIFTRGEKIIENLERLDVTENFRNEGKRMRRKQVKLPNTVGGFVAQKAFKWSSEKRGNTVIYRIWRIQ